MPLLSGLLSLALGMGFMPVIPAVREDAEENDDPGDGGIPICAVSSSSPHKEGSRHETSSRSENVSAPAETPGEPRTYQPHSASKKGRKTMTEILTEDTVPARPMTSKQVAQFFSDCSAPWHAAETVPIPRAGELLFSFLRASVALLQPTLLVSLRAAAHLARRSSRLSEALRAASAAAASAAHRGSERERVLCERADVAEAAAASANATVAKLEGALRDAKAEADSAGRAAAGERVSLEKQLERAVEDRKAVDAARRREATEAAAQIAELETALTKLRAQRKEDAKRVSREKAAAETRIKEAEESAARSKEAASAELARERRMAAEHSRSLAAKNEALQARLKEREELAAQKAAEVAKLNAELTALKRQSVIGQQQQGRPVGSPNPRHHLSDSAIGGHHGAWGPTSSAGSTPDLLSSFGATGPPPRASSASGLRAFMPAPPPPPPGVPNRAPHSFQSPSNRAMSPGVVAQPQTRGPTPPLSPHIKLGGPQTVRQATGGRASTTANMLHASPWGPRTGSINALRSSIPVTSALNMQQDVAQESSESPSAQIDAPSLLDLLPRDLLHS